MSITKPKVVIIHGLYMRAPIMFVLQLRLSKLGYDCISIDYATLRQTLAESAVQQKPILADFAAGEPLMYIGHSLGGLFIRHLRAYWPEGFVGSRVITLGTPHQGSMIAHYLRNELNQTFLIQEAWEEGLDGRAPIWDASIPLLSIAGYKAFGIGHFIGTFESQPNDGTVAVTETHLAAARAHMLCDETHTTLLFSRQMIQPIDRWLSLAAR